MRGHADIAELCVEPESTLREAIEQIDRNRRGVVMVVESDGTLSDLLTDGDVRRAVLAGTSLDEPVRTLLSRRRASPYAVPIAAKCDTSDAHLLSIMRERSVRQLPLLDAAGRVSGLVALEELLPEDGLPLRAVIMAGGAGKRLRPLTEDVPKPMLPVGDRPLLEHTIEALRDAGISRVHIATHYKPEKIVEHFGDGVGFGVDLHYLSEDRALGTAGALALLGECDEPLLVVNGDILTNVDFRAMLAYHQEHAAELTVGARRYEVQVPYGVLECDGTAVRSLTEKPAYRFLVNGGLYLIQPSALELVPRDEPFEMTQLIRRLLAGGRRVAAFPVIEYWLDIGEHPAYHRAQRDVRDGRVPR